MRLAPCPENTTPASCDVYGALMPPSVAPCECPQKRIAAGSIFTAAPVRVVSVTLSAAANLASDIWSMAPCTALSRAALGLPKL